MEKFKIVLIGNNFTGKSAVLYRFVGNVFDAKGDVTIGAVYRSKVIEFEGEEIELQMWDVAGQEKYRTMVGMYLSGAAGVILVSDVLDKSSYQNLQEWIGLVDKYSQDAPLILMGNKSDRATRDISKAEADVEVDKFNLTYFEVSAKSGDNVDQAFMHLIKEIKKSKSKIELLDPKQKKPNQGNGASKDPNCRTS